MSQQSIISTRDLTKSYGGVTAVNRVSLEIPQGFTVIHGESGSGKSTMLAMIAGQESPTSGTVLHSREGEITYIEDGTKVSRRERARKSNYLRHYTSFVSQQAVLLPSKTIEKNITLPLQAKGKSLSKPLFKMVAGRLGINDIMHKYPAEISGGQQQRAALTLGLLEQPDIAFLDEITSGLDTENARNTYKLLSSFATEQAVNIVLVSHDPVSVEYADTVIHMKDGQTQIAPAVQQTPSVPSARTPIFP